MSNIEITNHQLFALTASSSFGGSVIVSVVAVSKIAKQDAWITPIFTSFLGIFFICMIWFLGSQYPNETFVGICKKILGKWLGSLVAGSFVFLCLYTSWEMPWYISEFYTSQALAETPSYVVRLIFVIIMIVAILYGIETIARVSEVFLVFSSILFLLSMGLVLPKADITNLQPVLENGILPVFKSTVFLSSIFTLPLILLLMIFPRNTNNIRQAKKSLVGGYLWAGFLILISMLVNVMVLGIPIVTQTQYPTFLLAKEIEVGVVLTRLELLITVSWFLTFYIIAILFFYSSIIGLAELIGLKDYRRIVIPIGLIALVMSGVVFPDPQYQSQWDIFVWTPYLITHALILPIILLMVHLLKDKIPNQRKTSV